MQHGKSCCRAMPHSVINLAAITMFVGGCLWPVMSRHGGPFACHAGRRDIHQLSRWCEHGRLCPAWSRRARTCWRRCFAY